MTLVEVLIALGLSAIVTVGAFGLMASQRPIINSQVAVQKRQQDLWIAMELLQRDLHRAGMGFGFCRKTVGARTYRAQADCYGASGTAVGVLRAVDVTDGNTGADSITIRFSQPLGVGARDATLKGALALYSATSTVAVDSASDFMTPLGCTCSGGTTCTFPGTELALLYNPTDATKECVLVAVSASSCNLPKLTIDPKPAINCGVAPYTPASSQSFASDFGAFVNLGPIGSAITEVTYAIDPGTGALPMPTLTRNVNGSGAQVVAFGVEDLQIVPACDTNSDGQIGPEGATDTARTSDEWFNNVSGDTVAADCTSYPQVRVSIVARTTNPDAGWTLGKRPAVANRPAGNADAYRHRVLSAIVTAPNMGL